MTLLKKILFSLFLFSHQCLLPLAFRSTSPADYSKCPVFFIHGHGMSSKSWNALTEYMKDSGYPKLYLRAIQLKPHKGANIIAAEEQIAPAIEEFLSNVNDFIAANYPDIPLKTKVDLVSHSMGGLSARWYAARIRPDRVRIWISLAGANHGTNDLCPYVGIDSGGADDCCPAFAKNEEESYIQYQLNGSPHKSDIDETPYGIGIDSDGVNRLPPDQNRRILYITLRTMPDKWISPDESVILDGAGGSELKISDNIKAIETPEGNIRMENRVGHDEMLTDISTMRLVKKILDINISTFLDTEKK